MSISVQGISKNFKGRRKGEPDNQVLKDVSFEIEEGQFVCLLGPSGCGKTTTLTIVAGFQWECSYKTRTGSCIYVSELCIIPMVKSR